ncbi:uncharacterized protein PITG_02218 [Phytophthora infestans T30-4]|uniref:DDE Tnp4 domain-containing protein n=2 Tax=Phytophthora infestans TaxID=4787 RepID=D0MVS2_PHYIT|nr:uncharacterized protein PITG_02218 [Phytophthora infestans T30-4]EEY63735.1 conserved hypothetical protein [Phytophthora infestans T30-4]|eukprot:XP_002907171.1 conserved hypothetical protein [Phytophthora infestans T30-4]
MLQSAAHSSWFEDNLRCTQTTFLRIASFLAQHGVLFASAKVKQHSYNKKVAASLYFLGSSGGYRETGAAMGMSRSYVMEITSEVVRVLKIVAPQVISFPSNREEWNAVEAGFASKHGYPGIAGAIDGSLIEIERPDNFDGFYCRKAYPALNMQAIVTSDGFFLSVDVRPGSWSDSKCWQYSTIGRSVGNVLPAGKHFIGDAGYALLPWLIVPYCEREEGGRLSQQQKQFNFLHSSTRMAVECTFGRWKGRFRMLQCALSQETARRSANFVVATVVLHNLMKIYRDSAQFPLFRERGNENAAADDDIPSINLRNIGLLKRNAIAKIICRS